MTLVDSYLSGTQAIGRVSNYWNMFIMGFILIIILIAFYFSATAKTWMPACDKDGKSPSGTGSCGPSRTTVLLILGIIIIFISGLLYYTWSFRNNKAFQTAQGIGMESNILHNIFK